MSSAEWQLFHLRVSAEPDPGVLARVLKRFQNLNVTPRKVLAEWNTTGTLHLEIIVAGFAEPTPDLVAAMLGQVPSTFNAHWYR